MAAKVRHWKHGWIPISPEAKAYVAGEGPRPGADVPAADAVHSRLARGFRFTTVDGCPDVSFKEVQELRARPPEQYQEVARVAQALADKYPRAVNDPLGPNKIAIGFSDELPGDVMADTGAWASDVDKIRLNTDMWDLPEKTQRFMEETRKNRWGIFGEAPDLPTFRRYVLTHEIGHVLQARDERANSLYSKGAIDTFTDEPMTPRQAGYSASAIGLDTEAVRWQLDTLGKRSTYATTNRYEYFAEAFLDGTVNGDNASEAGKRAVEVAQQVFG